MQTSRAALATVAAVAVAGGGLTGLWHLRDNSAAELSRVRTTAPTGVQEVDCRSMQKQLIDPPPPVPDVVQRCFATTKVTSLTDFDTVVRWARTRGFEPKIRPKTVPATSSPSSFPFAYSRLYAGDAGATVYIIPPSFFQGVEVDAALPATYPAYIELTASPKEIWDQQEATWQKLQH